MVVGENMNRKYAIKDLDSNEAERLKYVLEHMAENKAFKHAINGLSSKGAEEYLNKFRQRYAWYRRGWRNFPKEAFENKLLGVALKAEDHPPLCVDIEVASVCDLACPHCYRQFIATPDKIMDPNLAFRLIDQASDLAVPSMKFNWRGEPLLNPNLPDFVDYAKRKGILETIINTNATRLNESMAEALIKSGLDLMIYSFDGGTKESYERMRPGRFSKNSFDGVYSNIRRFAKIREKMGSTFPRTRIQMVLTKETFDEQDSYFSLFNDCVDDVSVKQYTERGGKLSGVSDDTAQRFAKEIERLKLNPEAPIMRDSDGCLYMSKGRLPCEQIYQRLMVSYDGSVSMCCYDWGSMHPVGYVDDLVFRLGDGEYAKVRKKADSKLRGFEMMKLKMPPRYNKPEKVVQTLSEIWVGNEIDKVRHSHVQGHLEDVAICRICPFKETYQWEKVGL